MSKKKVFGVGWAKTGTTTLGESLGLLGFHHVGGRMDLVEHLAAARLDPILQVAREHDSAEDWPWLLLYRELDAAFPGSRFVLTTRDPELWLRSYRNMLVGQVANPTLSRRREVLYGFRVETASDEDLLKRVADHNDAVRSYFASRPRDLLEVDWSRGHGWPELCGFLDVPTPAGPFPHANQGSYRSAAWRRTLTKGQALIRRRRR